MLRTRDDGHHSYLYGHQESESTQQPIIHTRGITDSFFFLMVIFVILFLNPNYCDSGKADDTFGQKNELCSAFSSEVTQTLLLFCVSMADAAVHCSNPPSKRLLPSLEEFRSFQAIVVGPLRVCLSF